MTVKKTPKDKKNKTPKPRKKTDNPKGGRPSKLTEQVTKDFTDAIAEGAGYTLASRWAKVSEQATALWMREGRREQERRDMGEKADKSKEPYLRFLMAVREAEAEVGITWQQTISRAAKSDPIWADKMIGYRFPSDRVKLKEEDEVEIPKEMSMEYLQRIIAGESPLTVIEEWKKRQLLLSELNKNATKQDS